MENEAIEPNAENNNMDFDNRIQLEGLKNSVDAIKSELRKIILCLFKVEN